MSLALAGTSQADILGQYPQLEAEDVHQALGFFLNDIQIAIFSYRSSSLNDIQKGRIIAHLLDHDNAPDKLTDFKQLLTLSAYRARLTWD